MKSKLLNAETPRVFALVFQTGDDPLALILDFARQNRLMASSFTAIGAFSRATLGYFDFARMDYKPIPVAEQVEVVALTGNIAEAAGEPRLHIHAVLGRADGQALGGHLLEARVRPTLEVVLTEQPAHLARKTDPRTGLALLDLAERA